MTDETSTEAKKRTRRNGTIIGSAIDKLTWLAEQEQIELQQTPDVIRARFEKKRQQVLEPLDAAQRKAVLGAVSAAVSSEEATEPVTNSEIPAQHE